MKTSSFLILALICILWLSFVTACGNTSQQSSVDTTSATPTPEQKDHRPETYVSPTPSVPPPAPKANRNLTVEQLPQILGIYLPPEAQGKVRRSPLKHVKRVEAWFELAPQSASSERIRRYVTDYLIAAYRSEADIESASITIDSAGANGKVARLISVELGVRRGADLRGKQWAKWPIDTNTFFDWLNKHENSRGYREPRDRVEVKSEIDSMDKLDNYSQY